MNGSFGCIICEEVGVRQSPRIISDDGKVCKFRVPVLQEAGIVNRNRRTYSWKVLKKGVEHPFIQERLRTGTLYCEAGHPQERTIERQQRIVRTNASAIVKEIDLKEPVVVGSVVETASTQLGRDLRGLIVDNGCQVAFSMRGFGKINKTRKGVLVVEEPFRIVTWDEVVHPSVETAYMEGEQSVSKVGGSDIAHVGEEGMVEVLVEDAFKSAILALSPKAAMAADQLGFDTGADDFGVGADKNGNVFVHENGRTFVGTEVGRARKSLVEFVASFRSSK